MNVSLVNIGGELGGSGTSGTSTAIAGVDRDMDSIKCPFSRRLVVM